MKTISLPYYPTAECRGFFRWLFFKLSMDRVPLLLLSVRGKIYLAGNTPCPAIEKYKYMVEDLPWYRPAVFSYSEMLGHGSINDFEHQIHELYYCHHRNLFMNLIVVLNCLFRRLLLPFTDLIKGEDSPLTDLKRDIREHASQAGAQADFEREDGG